MTTNVNLLKNTKRISILEIDSLLSKLYLYESPYEIKEGIRYYRNTNKLVSESTSIIVIDNNNNKNTYKIATVDPLPGYFPPPLRVRGGG